MVSIVIILSVSFLVLIISNSVNHLRMYLQPSYPENNLINTHQTNFLLLQQQYMQFRVKDHDNSYFSS